MKSGKSSNKLVIYNALSTMLLYAITFLSAPLFSRMLGTNDYGIVQVYNTWVSFFTVIVGLYTRGTLSIARVNYDEEGFIRYQSSVLFLSTVSFLVFVVFLLFSSPIVVRFFGIRTGYLVMMLFHSFGVYCVYFINTKFTYEMKARNNLLISVSLALVNFGLSYFLVKIAGDRHRYAGRIAGMAVPYMVAGILVMIYVFHQGRTLYNKGYWRFCLPLCLPLIFHGISGMICASSDRVMIQKMVGLTAVGIYALAYNFANIMDSIWNALHNSWDPFFFGYVKQGRYEELKKRSKAYIRTYTCLSMGFILLTPEVYCLFASEGYWEGVFIIPVVVLSAYFIFIYAFAANYEFCFQRTDVVALGSAIAGVANIILNFFFINWLGYFGAAVATLLSDMILAVIHILFAKSLVKDRWIYDLKMFIAPAAGMSIAIFLFYVCYGIWAVRWGAAACTGIYMTLKIYKDKAIF